MPKILENLQKSSKVLPKVPFWKELYADLKKSSKIDDFWGGLLCNPYTPVQSKHTFPLSYFF